jgi:hypothetical protein
MLTSTRFKLVNGSIGAGRWIGVDHGESEKVAESLDLSKQREYMAVYSVVFGAHGKVRMTNTEGGGVL